MSKVARLADAPEVAMAGARMDCSKGTIRWQRRLIDGSTMKTRGGTNASQVRCDRSDNDCRTAEINKINEPTWPEARSIGLWNNRCS